MNGALIPDGLFDKTPWIANFFENETTVQFNHRIVAYVVAALGLMHMMTVLKRAESIELRHSAMLLGGGLIAQMGLGIVTLLHAVPIGLGCRICTRPDCPQRSAPPASRALVFNERERGIAPFIFAGD